MSEPNRLAIHIIEVHSVHYIEYASAGGGCIVFNLVSVSRPRESLETVRQKSQKSLPFPSLPLHLNLLSASNSISELKLLL